VRKVKRKHDLWTGEKRKEMISRGSSEKGVEKDKRNVGAGKTEGKNDIYRSGKRRKTCRESVVTVYKNWGEVKHPGKGERGKIKNCPRGKKGKKGSKSKTV